MVMGTGFLLLAYWMRPPALQAVVLFLSMGLNIYAIVRSFREKKKKNL